MTGYFPLSHLQETLFTASEAWKITDVNPPVQRDWRTRGLLAKNEGWTRFTPEDLIHVALRDAMRHLGLPHTSADVDLRDAALQAQYWAAVYPGAVGHKIGTNSEDHPIGSLMPGAQFRFAATTTPWQDFASLQLFADFDDLSEMIAAEDCRSGVAIIDLKAVGLKVAERAGKKLWLVARGPSAEAIALARDAARNGDELAKEALRDAGFKSEFSK